MNTTAVGNEVGTVIILVWCGALLLIFLRAADQIPFLRRRTVAWQFLNVTGWILLTAGGLLAGAALLVFGVIGFFIGLVVFVMALVRFFMCRRSMLLWSLSAAAQHRLPLAPVARSIVGDGNALGRRRVGKLADMLESGYPLAEALSASGLLSRNSGRPLIRVGQQCGAVAPALDLAVAEDRGDAAFWQHAAGRVFYLAMISVISLFIVTFVMLQIVPAFAKIFSDFQAELPAATKILIYVSDILFNWGWILFPLQALVLIALLYVTLRYIGMGPVGWPIVGRLSRGAHTATVLRCLALAADRGRPFEEVLATLADWHPAGNLRRQLRTAATEIDRGASWQSALEASRIFGKSDLAFLDAAQRAGNLPWALRELADRSARRYNYRAHSTLQIITPLLVLALGAMVAMVVIALFLPLVQLIVAIS